jgi:hypothetical protein
MRASSFGVRDMGEYGQLRAPTVGEIKVFKDMKQDIEEKNN